MKVIYIDVLVGVNLAIDYLLLCATSRLSNVYCKRTNLLLGAIIGAIYAVFSCIEPSAFLSSIPIKIIVGFIMVYISFWKQKILKILKLLVLFLGLSFASAGAVLAVGNASNTNFFAGEGYYIDVPFRVVVATIIFCWVITGYIFRGDASDKISPRKTVNAEVCLNNNCANFTLLVDTGNTLHDPISGKPIIILDRNSVSKLFPSAVSLVINRLSSQSATCVLNNIPDVYKSRFRLVPFNAVGKDNGLLLVFKPDSIKVSDKTLVGLIAISSNSICSGKYDGLIGV